MASSASVASDASAPQNFYVMYWRPRGDVPRVLDVMLPVETTRVFLARTLSTVVCPLVIGVTAATCFLFGYLLLSGDLNGADLWLEHQSCGFREMYIAGNATPPELFYAGHVGIDLQLEMPSMLRSITQVMTYFVFPMLCLAIPCLLSLACRYPPELCRHQDAFVPFAKQTNTSQCQMVVIAILLLAGGFGALSLLGFPDSVLVSPPTRILHWQRSHDTLLPCASVCPGDSTCLRYEASPDLCTVETAMTAVCLEGAATWWRENRVVHFLVDCLYALTVLPLVLIPFLLCLPCSFYAAYQARVGAAQHLFDSTAATDFMARL